MTDVSKDIENENTETKSILDTFKSFFGILEKKIDETDKKIDGFLGKEKDIVDGKEKDIVDGKEKDIVDGKEKDIVDTNNKGLSSEEVAKIVLNTQKDIKLQAELDLLLKNIPVKSKNLLDNLLEGIEDNELKISKINTFKDILGSIETTEDEVVVDDMEKNKVSEGFMDFLAERGKNKEWVEKALQRNKEKDYTVRDKKRFISLVLSGDMKKLEQYKKMEDM